MFNPKSFRENYGVTADKQVTRITHVPTGAKTDLPGARRPGMEGKDGLVKLGEAVGAKYQGPQEPDEIDGDGNAVYNVQDRFSWTPAKAGPPLRAFLGMDPQD